MSYRALVALFLVTLSALHTLQPAQAQQVVPAGAGSYYNGIPEGRERPVDNNGAPVTPKVSPAFVGAPPTNEFWSSLIWKRDPTQPFGAPIYPLPLAIKAQPDGLDLGRVITPAISQRGYSYGFGNPQAAMRITVSGLTAQDVLVDRAGDWSATALWKSTSPARELRVTFARGCPFVYATATGGTVVIKFNSLAGPATVWANTGSSLGVTIAGVPYALFAPTGRTWSVTSTQASLTFASPTANYFSIATLPAQGAPVLSLFQQHAFAFVTDTRASWTYDTANAKVNASFQFITQAMEGTQTSPLVCLFRHQWLNSTMPLTTWIYPSPRGQMKLAAAANVTASFPFAGLVPNFPDTGAMSQAELYSLINQVYLESNLNPSGDSYGSGKAYGRIAQLIPLADQCGHTLAKQRFLDFLRTELADWFSVGAGLAGTSAYTDIQAENYAQAQGVTVGASPTGQAVLDFGANDWVRINNVDFGSSTPTRLLLNFASGTSGSGLFQLRLDSLTGPILSEGGVGSTGGVNTWIEVALGLTAAGVDAIDGVHDLYLTINSPYQGELIRIDSLRFDRAGSGGTDRVFTYEPAWKTLIAQPASFGLGSELNDHHFHYGYFLMAAATVARYDSNWADQFAPMIDLMIRDAANWDRTDARFPILRNFDPYAGYSYASGHQAFFAGNNQESSSESMNFATACVLWGVQRQNQAVRDLGLFLHATEAAAIHQYWFDADNQVYPPNANYRMAGLIWCNGADYATWFTANPALIHGINFLPITPGSMYLGLRPDAMNKNWNILMSQTAGNPDAWLDINWSARAMANPADALARWTANQNYTPEAGDSRARTVHFLRTLAATGTLDPTIKADIPTFLALCSNEISHRFAYNPGNTPLLVTFSDGVHTIVAPREVAHVVVTPTAACDPIDFNNNGVFPEDQDVIDFFAVLAGGSPASCDPIQGCNDIDFNNNSIFPEDQDVVDFLNVLAGGVCP
ncbi:MAG TPA: glycosyl hydrolase [Phycisphaerales bacterium]|nr:glycosyl hydrolase [Phycisphaerales bacterium]